MRLESPQSPERYNLKVKVDYRVWATIHRIKMALSRENPEGALYTRDDIIEAILTCPKQGIALLDMVKDSSERVPYSAMPRGNRYKKGPS